MKKFKKTAGIILSLLLISLTIIPCTVAYAQGGMAFSVGTDYGGLFGVDTSSDATNARDLYAIAGYSSYSSTQPTVSIMRGNFTNGIKRMKSDILFFSGHGNYNNVSFNYNGNGGNYATGVWYTTDCTTTDGYQMVGLSGNMGSVKLATFAACLTASNNDNNITAKAVYYGADTAVGWSSEVNAGSHSNWLARYNDKLATGSTVLQAVTYANSFTYLDSDVKDARIYGNRNLKIKQIATSSLVADEQINTIDVSEPILNIEKSGINKDLVFNAARVNIPNFNSSDYSVRIHELCDDCYTVDFVFTVGNVQTNSSYTMTIIDNKIMSIVDNTIDFDKKELIEDIAKYKLDCDGIVMDTAKEKTNSSSLKDVIKQEVINYYDVQTGSLKKVVFSVYQFDGTEAVGKDVYIENIN